MGLDIAFNRKAAIDAGLHLETMRRGSEEDIAETYIDPDHMAWLMEEITCIHVPFAQHLVEDDGDDERIIIRANKWGRTYHPLTMWLKLHGIEWDEF